MRFRPMSSPLLPTLLSLVLLLSASAACAQSDDAASLPEWDRLTPQQREALIAPMRERWNGTPERRTKMLEHARRWREMTPDERKRARHGVRRWQEMSPEKREQMRALYGELRTLPEAERRALRERWMAMTPEQRRAWIDANQAPEQPQR